MQISKTAPPPHRCFINPHVVFQDLTEQTCSFVQIDIIYLYLSSLLLFRGISFTADSQKGENLLCKHQSKEKRMRRRDRGLRLICQTWSQSVKGVEKDFKNEVKLRLHCK